MKRYPVIATPHVAESPIPEPPEVGSKVASVRSLLSEHGMRQSHARITVLSVLIDNPGRFLHPAEVLQCAMARGSYLTLASAYRQLAYLAEAGLLQRSMDHRGNCIFCYPGTCDTARIGIHCLNNNQHVSVLDPVLHHRLLEFARNNGFPDRPVRITLSIEC